MPKIVVFHIENKNLIIVVELLRILAVQKNTP